MKNKSSTTQRIRAMIDSGHHNKTIIDRVKCKPQAVYNIRYQMNKERGLGSIGMLPKPVDGIGAPPKRKYVRKVKAGTGIPDWTPPPLLPMPELPVTMIEKPTLWQRIKGWFHG